MHDRRERSLWVGLRFSVAAPNLPLKSVIPNEAKNLLVEKQDPSLALRMTGSSLRCARADERKDR
jgi:hypothetical protein